MFVKYNSTLTISLFYDNIKAVRDNNNIMIIYKGREYYTNKEMLELFGSYDYNHYTVRFKKISIPAFRKEEVDRFLLLEKKKWNRIHNINLDIITNELHRKIAEDRLTGNYTMQGLADKYGMSKQNVFLILSKYKRLSSK